MEHVLTILAVDDLEAMAAFHRAALGWQTAVDVPVYVELVSPGGRRLGLYQREAFARVTGERPASREGLSGCELYFHCDDPAAAAERVAAAGGRLLSPLAPRPWGDLAAYFADPEGNVVVVARPLTA